MWKRGRQQPLAQAIAATIATTVACAPPTQGDGGILVRPKVHAVWAGNAYAYVIAGDEDVALIDSGSDPDATALRATLRQLGRDVGEVHAVLLTHAHPDQWAGVQAFAAARIYVGRADYAALANDRLPRAPWPRFKARLGNPSRRVLDIHGVLPGELIVCNDLRFAAIALPGHSPGSVAYLFGDILFTGDSLLQDGGGGLTLGSWYTAASRAQNRRSLTRLAHVPFQAIADARHGVTPDGRTRFDGWLRKENHRTLHAWSSNVTALYSSLCPSGVLAFR